jgi:hypothetical protein
MRLSAIWASEYVLIRRIPILLLNKGEVAVFKIPLLLKALGAGGNCKETADNGQRERT